MSGLLIVFDGGSQNCKYLTTVGSRSPRFARARDTMTPKLSISFLYFILFFFFQAEDGIRDLVVTGVQTCALPIAHGSFLPRYASTGDHRTLTRYPPSPSSNPHSLTIPRSSPCNSVFTRPRSTGPPVDPFPFPVMIWTTAPALRRRQLSRNARRADRASIAPNPCRSSSPSAGASSSGSRASNAGWPVFPRLPTSADVSVARPERHSRSRFPDPAAPASDTLSGGPQYPPRGTLPECSPR